MWFHISVINMIKIYINILFFKISELNNEEFTFDISNICGSMPEIDFNIINNLPNDKYSTRSKKLENKSKEKGKKKIYCLDNGWEEKTQPFTKQPCTINRKLLIENPGTIEGFFDLFFTKQMIDYIIFTTNISVQRDILVDKAKQKDLLTKCDLMKFIAIMMILGINNVPNYNNCWNKKKIFSYNRIISNLMTLKRFQKINKYINILSYVDFNEDEHKIKRTPIIIDYIERLFSRILLPGKQLSLDEGVMGYKGRMLNRVYSPGKKEKWGMRFYILADSVTGFIYNIRIVGEKTTINETVKDLVKNIKYENRILFMDNFYNSYKLCCDLLDLKIYTLGTLRDMRGGPKDLQTIKKLTPKESSKYFFKNKVQLLIYNDTKPVSIITTAYDISQEVKTDKTTLPMVVNEYNKFMGGVDLYDQLISYYPLKRKTKNWRQRFTCYIIQLLVHNSYVLYNDSKIDKKILHYDYMEHIIKYLIKLGTNPINNEQQSDKNLFENEHQLIRQNIWRNCKVCLINKVRKQTKFKCSGCEHFFCPAPCFANYHNNESSDSDDSD